MRSLRGGFRVWIRFQGGLQCDVDLSGYTTFGPVFEPLAEESFFKNLPFRVARCLGRMGQILPPSVSMNWFLPNQYNHRTSG